MQVSNPARRNFNFVTTSNTCGTNLRKAQPGGGKPDKKWRDALDAALRQGDNLKKLAEKCVSLALGGDMTAIKEIGDRLDGKPTQPISGPDDGPIEITDPKAALLRGVIRDAAEGGADSPDQRAH